MFSELSNLSDSQPSLCIPRVFNNIGEAIVRKVFSDLNLGQIQRVDILDRKNEKGEKFKRVYIHFEKWYWNPEAQTTRSKLVSGKEIKIVYDNPWFWKVSANKWENSKTYIVNDNQIDMLTNSLSAVSIAPALSNTIAPTLNNVAPIVSKAPVINKGPVVSKALPVDEFGRILQPKKDIGRPSDDVRNEKKIINEKRPRKDYKLEKKKPEEPKLKIIIPLEARTPPNSPPSHLRPISNKRITEKLDEVEQEYTRATHPRDEDKEPDIEYGVSSIPPKKRTLWQKKEKEVVAELNTTDNLYSDI
jgi:hypothetical protein